MNKKSLKLTGRVVSVNHADQSVLLESTEKSNRLRVYTDNEQFKRLSHIITESRFNGVNAKETTGIFYIQGKVLIGFELTVKSTKEESHSVLDFIRQLNHALTQDHAK